jgi:Dyp-type peroxidase family
MPIQLRLHNIQGNVIPGFRSDYQSFLLIRFPEGQSARAWLKELQPEVTSARQVDDFLAARRGAARPHDMSATWLNVAFSWQGLKRLGGDLLADFPNEFRQGMFARAQRLGDDPGSLRQWEVGGTREREAHVLLILAAGSPADLQRDVKSQTSRIARYGVGQDKLFVYEGQRLQGELRGREHFGFLDGVSQPVLDIEGVSVHPDERSELVRPGEFIVGYPDERGVTRAESGWTQDGSYVVFRRFRQHVAGFRQWVTREAAALGLSSEQLAAKLVGRWPSGAGLADASARKDPGLSDIHRAFVRPFDFAKDPLGERWPRFAHIRKSYPRDVASTEPRRHRLLRRGIPYGPPLPSSSLVDDGQDRGLLFLAYQASLARQFEHVQQRFLNDANFPREGDGPDPLVGQPQGRGRVRLRRRGGGVSRLNLEQFVSVTSGGYFFAPSIRALAQLADSTQKGQEAHMPYEDSYRDLSEFIFDENPYTTQGQLRPGFQSVAEIDDFKDPKGDGELWAFGGRPRKVAKALRIPYRYRDKDGRVKTEHLLVGYEGAGSDD